MPVEENEISAEARGGTELISRAMADKIDPELLKEVQIIPSRVCELDPDKIRILHLHDLPGHAGAHSHLVNRGW